ncbi:Phosphoesterase [Granulibacter bethesdensis]|uniref:Phosphoesterase n=1 Tax=Granulibacter bethesdensis TaxID=364410 RepID=A0AAC9P839_9PROT|nr:Phosphoesterase [Granulibacter bethesdensis]APH61738.1 Phosphoesterase [Granulibacter bethesdensis]
MGMGEKFITVTDRPAPDSVITFPRHPPAGVPIRVIGDVHGDARAFTHAVTTDRFIIQLGDLTDGGPENGEVLRIMLNLLHQGRGLFLLGNHDLRLARRLAGRSVRPDPTLEETCAQIDTLHIPQIINAIAHAPAWIVSGNRIFLHGGFHTDMLHTAPPFPVPIQDGRVHGVLARALYGEPTGQLQPDGYPERSLRWVDRIPKNLIVYCGHDNRSPDGRPLTMYGQRGGTAIFLDTGAGKGGHLSWIDLDS